MGVILKWEEVTPWLKVAVSPDGVYSVFRGPEGSSLWFRGERLRVFKSRPAAWVAAQIHHSEPHRGFYKRGLQQ